MPSALKQSSTLVGTCAMFLMISCSDSQFEEKTAERTQPSTLEREPTIAPLVEDSPTTYPLKANPLEATQQAKLVPSNGDLFDYFGYSVSISGDTAIVGAHEHSVGMSYNQGVVYVFDRNGETWTEMQQLQASDGIENDYFGWAVALSGDTAVIGAPRDSMSKGYEGSAYVFVRNGSTWTQQQKLIASDAAIYAEFGSSVAISESGDTIAVGATGGSFGASKLLGAGYVFVRNGETWTEQAKLVPSDPVTRQSTSSITVQGNTAILAAHGEEADGMATRNIAYVFVRNGSTWTEQARLIPSGKAFDDSNNGWFVSLWCNTAVVGTYFHTIGTNYGQGAAYVFVRNGSTWSEQAQLVASDGKTDDRFGMSVAVVGNTAVVGAGLDDSSVYQDQGSAYVFVREGQTWSQQAKLVADDGGKGYRFGTTVSISGDKVLIGAHDSPAGGTISGAAYVYELEPRIEDLSICDDGPELVGQGGCTCEMTKQKSISFEPWLFGALAFVGLQRRHRRRSRDLAS